MGAISSQNYVARFHKIKNSADKTLLDHEEKLKSELSKLIGDKASTKGSIENLTHDDYVKILADLHNTKINDGKPETFHNLLDKAKFKTVSEGLNLFCTHIGYDKKRATEKVKALQELVGLEDSDIEIDNKSLSGNNIKIEKTENFTESSNLFHNHNETPFTLNNSANSKDMLRIKINNFSNIIKKYDKDKQDLISYHFNKKNKLEIFKGGKSRFSNDGKFHIFKRDDTLVVSNEKAELNSHNSIKNCIHFLKETSVNLGHKNFNDFMKNYVKIRNRVDGKNPQSMEEYLEFAIYDQPIENTQDNFNNYYNGLDDLIKEFK